jgi:cobalt/nickel transport system permease protein
MGLADWLEVGRMDELGRLDTPLHRLDARAKTVVTVAFVVVVMSFPRHAVSALTPFLLYPIALLSLGRIPGRHILKKILVAMPFALAIGLFNPIMDRQPLVVIGPWVVSGGWCSFASILLRFVLTVSAALTLIACTGMHRLGAGLEQLGVPRVFVAQLLFLHRYLFVLADEGQRTLRAVALRTEGGGTLRLRVYGALVGHLLLRAMGRSERIHRAMLARGFTGELPVLRTQPWNWSETRFTLAWLVFFIVARRYNLANSLGHVLLGAVA